MRRFPPNPQIELGFEGGPFVLVAAGFGLLVAACFVARYVSDDNQFETTKRHHPKGIGYTSINKQKDK